MTWIITASLLIGSAMGAPLGEPSRPVKLKDVLERAGQRAQASEARLHLAESQAKYLETLNKLRFELRPNLGWLAFSNPWMLASNVGSSLLISRRTAPPQVAMQNAWFDVLAAELAAEQIRVKSEAEATKAFYALLEHQETAHEAHSLIAARESRLQQMDSLLKAARVTALDKTEFEYQLLEIKLQSSEAESQRGLAALDLAVLMGDASLAAKLRVEETEDWGGALDRPLPSDERLLQSAMLYRQDSKLLRERIEALRKKAAPSRAPKFESVSGTYSSISNTSGNAAKDFLLGGNNGRIDLGFSIQLRNTGEKAAQEDVVAARVKLLETEIRNMEEDVRAQVYTVRNLAGAALERLQIARQKVELTKSAERLMNARVENGLNNPSAALAAEQNRLRANIELYQAQCSRKANLYTLLVLCGWKDQDAGLRAELLGDKAGL